MKNLLFILTFFTLFTFSQTKENKPDSITYFLELANYSFEEKYNSKDAIKYVQKAIEYSKEMNCKINIFENIIIKDYSEIESF